MFRHELEWFGYYYVEEIGKVCICHKTLQPVTCYFYSREKLEELIQFHKFNVFKLLIYKEAIKYFPQENKS